MTTYYMTHTPAGERIHLVEDAVLRRALYLAPEDRPDTVPTLCGLRVDGQHFTLGAARRTDAGMYLVPYAEHWDTPSLCRHCRNVERRAPEYEDAVCSVSWAAGRSSACG